MKYVIKINGDEYVREVAWFSDTLPVVTLTTYKLENAKQFSNKSKERIFKNNYKDAEFIPIKITIAE